MELDRQTAIQQFREQRMKEPLEDYLDLFDARQAVVEELLEATEDLARIHDMAVDVLKREDFLEVLRYLSGPVLSADDLKTLADLPSLSASALRRALDGPERVIAMLLLGLDRRRFPWVAENREPTEREREAAALATAALMANGRMGTNRRISSKVLQETAVRDVLLQVGMQSARGKHVRTLDDAPARGQFYRGDVIVGPSRKADLVVRLWDGRLMPVECKVSNSTLNSIKRLNNDAVVKALEWKKELGHGNTVPAALLAGVYTLRRLEFAQDQGLLIFWSHNLQALTDYIEASRPAS